MTDEYRTIKTGGEGYYTDKRSKFLAFGLDGLILVVKHYTPART